MIHVQFMKPFYTKVTGDKMRLVFAYQYFLIMKDDEVFHFIPIEGKEIIVNLTTMQVENLSEVFVFQRGNRFIRLPLYQLMLISNMHEHLMPLLEKVAVAPNEEENVKISSEVQGLINELEQINLDCLIDNALAVRDEVQFKHLIKQKAKLSARQ